jgi:peptide/nickel transport system substrate-binding protein
MLAGLAVAALLVAACSGNAPTPPRVSAVVSHARLAGGTASWAEPSGSTPNYIFPFMNLTYDSAANVDQLQELMYRPLYWFGRGSSPVLKPTLSLARPPAYSDNDQTITIDLRSYRWSNGESVDATDVMFWMNMLHAEKGNWASYAPGLFPDDVHTVTIDNPEELTFQLVRPSNPAWFTGNQLSQITPLPVAWDITKTGAAPGSGGCSAAAYGSADLACDAVYTFLSGQSGPASLAPGDPNPLLSSYVANPLWQVVDGPWHLTSIDADGNLRFEPNRSYSGPVKPTLTAFVELPFSSAADEFTALTEAKVDVGYLPEQDVPPVQRSGPAPNNPDLADYRLDPRYAWALQYIPYNFHSTGDGAMAGKIFSQLYIRQALQLLVDQPGIIGKVLAGYGAPTYGPVPVEPANPFASTAVMHNPYPYDPSRAIQLLKANGWNVVPGGTSTCLDPGAGTGQCGSGIAAGTSLTFTLPYAADVPWTNAVLTAEKSSWARAGIAVTLTPEASATVLTAATPCTGGPGCAWELEDWGTGWPFAPDHYPSGEQLFGSAAAPNAGSFSDFVNDEQISQTERTPTDLTAYENYLATQLPVLFEPAPAASLTEVRSTLQGVVPQNASGVLTPEDWYFVG